MRNPDDIWYNLVAYFYETNFTSVLELISVVDLVRYVNGAPYIEQGNNRVDERVTYHFETTNVGMYHWGAVSSNLKQFYKMCGHFSEHDIVGFDKCELICRRYKLDPLPLYNPVVFFQKLMELTLPKDDYRYLFFRLLPYALAGRGGAFGTAYDFENNHCARLSDMDFAIPVIEDSSINENLLMAQAQLRGNHAFQSDYARYVDTVMKLECQQKRVSQWVEECEEEKTQQGKGAPSEYPRPWRGNLEHWKEMFFAFMDLYEDYCLSQFPEDASSQRAQTKQQLRQVYLSAQFIFKMEGITAQLYQLGQVKDATQNLLLKSQWIDMLKREVNSKETGEQIEAMKVCFPEQFRENTYGNLLYQVLIEGREPSYNEKRSYPLLDENVVFQRLNKEEKHDLYWYREYPVALWVDHLCRGPRRETLRKAMPFYLSFHFIHKSKPLRPFLRIDARFSPKKLPFGDRIAFSNHAAAVRNQACHYKFYLGIASWCQKYFPDTIDMRLCHSLYTTHRLYLVTERPSTENYFMPNDLHTIYQGLLQLFEFPISMFPQYTDGPISLNEFHTFFYSDSSRVVKEVRKCLGRRITLDRARQYKELTFLDPAGFGHSYFPEVWHRRLAEWLSEIINEDGILSAYVGNDSVHLAQVELAIQFLCCHQIQLDMSQATLRFCKCLMSS